MLVLTRKKDESILIGNNILVTFLKFTKGPNGQKGVSIGITAPKEIPIKRTEDFRGTAIEEVIILQLPGTLTC